MAVVNSNRIRVQRTLIDLMESFACPIVLYDTNHRPLDPDSASTSVPGSVNTNEVSGSFREDEDFKRGVADIRDPWNFEINISYPTEVLLEPLEEQFLSKAIHLPESAGLRSVSIRMIAAEYAHPVQGNPATGTSVKYLFTATEGRR